MFKKILGIGLAAVMAFSVSTMAVSAEDINQSGGQGTSRVELSANASPLKVTVPSVLPIWVDSDNNVTVATDAKITNLSAAPVEVTNVSVTGDNDWSVVPFDTDFSEIPVDTKQYGMTMYNDDVVDGVNAMLFGRIDGGEFVDVVYDGNVAIQSTNINKFDIGHVVFTVAYARAHSFERLFSPLRQYSLMSSLDMTKYIRIANEVKANLRQAIRGDITLDGKADVMDATIIRSFADDFNNTADAYRDYPEAWALLMAVSDTNGDGTVTNADATEIQRYIAGYNNVYSIDQPVDVVF